MSDSSISDNILNAIQKAEEQRIMDLTQQQDDLFEQKSQYSVLEYGDQLRNRTYTVDGKQAKTTKDSKEMTAILEGMEALNELFGMLSFQTDDKKLFLNEGTTLLDQMRHVVAKCDKYLDEKHPWTKEGKARYNIVKQMSERLSKDILVMKPKLRGFFDAPKEERARVKSWEDFLRWERTVSYKDGENGVKVTHTGGNTSDVIVIEKDGKRFFFKKEDKLMKPYIEDVVGYHQDEIWKSDKKKVLEKGTIPFYKYNFLEEFLKEFSEKFEEDKHTAVLKKCKIEDEPFEDLKAAIDLMKFNKNGKVVEILETIDEHEEGEFKEKLKSEIAGVFAAIRKDFIGAKVGADNATITPGEGLVKRNVATSELANLLGLDALIPHSEMATVEVNGEKMYGIIMEDAGGEESSDILYHNKKMEYVDKEVVYSSNAVKDCYHMQWLDVLCCQVDRHEGNRMFDMQKSEKDDGVYEVKGLKGIDNDMSFGNVSFEEVSVKKRFRGMFDNNGICVPMSEELATKILEMDANFVNYCMLGTLNEWERESLVDRLKGVQMAIRKRIVYEKNHPGVDSVFIKDGEWDAHVDKLKDKIKGNKTYAEHLSKATYIMPMAINGWKMK